MAAVAFGSALGRSVPAKLTLANADPGRQVAVGAVVAWVSAWRDNHMKHEVMHDVWRYAVRTVGMSGKPTAAVKGDAGAYFDALRRLQWKAPFVHSVCSRDGTILFFGNERAP